MPPLGHEQEVLERIGSSAGVQAIGAANHLPLSGEPWLGSFAVRGYDHPPGDLPHAYPAVVTEGYFAAMGIPVVSGRVFSSADRQDTQPVAVVSRPLADQFWPDGGAVGGHVFFPWMDEWIEVVGVVGEVSQEVLTSRGDFAIYLPFAQAPQSAMTLVIQATGDVAGIAAGVRRTVAEIDPNVPVSEVRPAGQLVRTISRYIGNFTPDPVAR
jgi:putative ABC transport system permease protein